MCRYPVKLGAKGPECTWSPHLWFIIIIRKEIVLYYKVHIRELEEN